MSKRAIDMMLEQANINYQAAKRAVEAAREAVVIAQGDLEKRQADVEARLGELQNVEMARADLDGQAKE